MAHEIESIMYVGATPWHKLGTKLLEVPTVQEGIRAAGLDWQVIQRALYLGDGRCVSEARANTRSTDDAILGVVGPQYQPLQNRDAFNWFQPFLDAKEATLETAGSLRQGKRVFILAKLARDPMLIAPNDPVEKYILLSNSHDGTMAVRVGFTPIRVVCNNTLSMAINSGASSLLRVRHTGQTVENLELVREIMNTANAQFEATAAQYRDLARRQISVRDLETYVKRVFDIQDLGPESNAGKRILRAVIPLFEKGRGNDMPGVRGTYWAAYNAITEYTGHERGRDDDKRLDSVWFGNGSTTNRRALEIAVDMVAA